MRVRVRVRVLVYCLHQAAAVSDIRKKNTRFVCKQNRLENNRGQDGMKRAVSRQCPVITSKAVRLHALSPLRMGDSLTSSECFSITG